MKVEFLGGAEEVGASCLLLELEKTRILIDCGIRMHGANPQPDLARLQDGKSLDAVIITHAHLDHSGSLPLISRAFPTVRIFMTPPTLSLVQILLEDAIKVMQFQLEREKDIPLYSESAVTQMLQSVLPVHYHQPLKINDECRFTYFPAGHIAGAAAVGLETIEGNVFISGDFSVDEQLTVSGMTAPKFKAHLAISESTYGGRLHADRDLEQRRLIQQVVEVIESGGKVVIPAFALGRAQEVILILQRAMRSKEIPRFPVYVDGLVRNICTSYAKFPFFLTTRLKKEIEKWGDPFFGILDNIKRVTLPRERLEIIQGPPCCIVSSSGMLSGGPSLFYASRLMKDKNNLIAITGYQDEESPGARLLNLADGKERTITVENDQIEVQARIIKYALSAHADSNQILGLISHVKPRELLLVHGDQEARSALKDLFQSELKAGIHLPANGESMLFRLRRTRAVMRLPTVDLQGIGKDRPLDEPGLVKIAEMLAILESAGRRLFSVQEILEVWHGPGRLNRELIDTGLILLTQTPVFIPDRKRPYLFTIKKASATNLTLESIGRWEQNKVLAEVKRRFPESTGCYKCGAIVEENRLVLSFHFPKIAQAIHHRLIEELERVSGWQVTINPEVHHGLLTAKAIECIPQSWGVIKTPSIYRETEEVHVKVAEKPDPKELHQLQIRFLEATGYNLVISHTPQLMVSRHKVFYEDGRMEINALFRVIDQAFASEPHQPYRKGKKSDNQGTYIELSFISGIIGERYRPIIDQLTEATHWQFKINPRVNQSEVLRIARELLAKKWQIKKGPSFYATTMEVQVHFTSPPATVEFEMIRTQFEQLTGLKLVII